MRKLQTAALTVTAFAALTATACGSSDDDGGAASTATVTVTAPGTAPASAASTAAPTPAASPSASASQIDQAVRAIRSAERRVPNGKAYDIETDRLRGKPVWEVKVARGTTRAYELDVSADGRKVLRRRAKTVDDDVRKLRDAKVGLAKALRTAARRAKGAAFDSAEIDRSGGRLVWEATFKAPGDRELEVDVDARTGKVLRVRTDD